MITLHDNVELPAVGMSGFETPLTEEEAAIQHNVHRFARDVMRPIAQELDRMTPEEVVAPTSPYWTVFSEFAKLDLDPALIAQFPPETAVRIESLIGEELGWGDAGLGVSLGAAGFPLQMAQAVGNKELVELSTGKIGCWIITQPDKGSDTTTLYPRQDGVPGEPFNRGNLLARGRRRRDRDQRAVLVLGVERRVGTGRAGLYECRLRRREPV